MAEVAIVGGGIAGLTAAALLARAGQSVSVFEQAFIETTRTGDLSGLMALFADDSVMTSDGGGKVRAALHPVQGPDSIARFLTGVLKKNEGWDAIHSQTEINGQPAFITSIAGEPISATILDIRGGLIRNLFIIANPDKLRNLQ